MILKILFPFLLYVSLFNVDANLQLPGKTDNRQYQHQLTGGKNGKANSYDWFKPTA